MCRFLMMRGRRPFAGEPVFDRFRRMCEASVEYQGHGWGISFRAAGTSAWSRHRSLTPIWEDSLEFPEPVDFLVIHARSAFRDTGIALENNMPFYRGERIFVFNGELRGVRLQVPGRIGAEKVLHLVERHSADGLPAALSATDHLLLAKSDYVRASNVAVTDGERIHAICRYNESPEYFTLHYLPGEVAAVCSEPFDDRWVPMSNGEQLTL